MKTIELDKDVRIEFLDVSEKCIISYTVLENNSIVNIPEIGDVMTFVDSSGTVKNNEDNTVGKVEFQFEKESYTLKLIKVYLI